MTPEEAKRKGIPVIPKLPEPNPFEQLNPHNPVVAVCGECGLELCKVMGYVCFNPRCPTGLGPVMCQQNMKLSQLTPEQKTRLLAELDGLQVRIHKLKGYKVPYIWEYLRHPELKDDWCVWEPKKYDKSYDAIILLVQKLKSQEIETIRRYLQLDDAFNVWEFTPAQLCDAVLVATGKAEV